MVQVKKYHLPPTPLIPSSPYPLLHYPGFFSSSSSSFSPTQQPNLSARNYHSVFTAHGWETQWVFRYGATQHAHYHSQTHECMAVLCGTARIRFGAADGEEKEEGDALSPAETEEEERPGVEVEAGPGDVFVVPAGVAHKTFDVSPKNSEFRLLTPGDGHGVKIIEEEEEEETKTTGKEGKEETRNKKIGEVLAGLEIDGFAMIGAYSSGGVWDFAVGGEIDVGSYGKVWAVPKPEMDPVLGDSVEGLRGSWGRQWEEAFKSML